MKIFSYLYGSLPNNKLQKWHAEGFVEKKKIIFEEQSKVINFMHLREQQTKMERDMRLIE